MTPPKLFSVLAALNGERNPATSAGLSKRSHHKQEQEPPFASVIAQTLERRTHHMHPNARPAAHKTIKGASTEAADQDGTCPRTGAARESAAPPDNIIPFPGSAVIVPFPVIPPVDVADTPSQAGGTGDAQRPDLSAAGADSTGLAEVEIDVAWPPRPPAESSNICEVDFGTADPQAPAAEAEVLKVDFRASEASASTSHAGAEDATQLPEAGVNQEEIAGSLGADEAAFGPSGVPSVMEAPPPPSETPRDTKEGKGMSTAEVAGTAVAKQASGMNSTNGSEPGSAFLERHEKDLEELDGISVRISQEDVRLDELSSSRSLGATEWQVGRPVGMTDRPAPVPPGIDTEAAPGVGIGSAVERLSQLVLRETSLVRQHGPGSMAVVLRPEPGTELFVHFTSQRNGQVQATVRCERGEFQHLNALWPQLQESLALHKVNLAPLQESTSAAANSDSPASASRSDSSPGAGSSGFGPSHHAPERHGSPDESLAERPVPASTASASTRGECGSRPTLATSRPGWETWA
jgi:hypothetical protein